ncbi:unnamed protein product [Prorocentrum cordatum]|uniref:Uncharacterized protein n=1 Tax=Prorocentrum cordatum TaxID=2364126 RepID=A0ABN9UGK1_9DINO|nr:unnamed protein product [Polarella glacialis]
MARASRFVAGIGPRRATIEYDLGLLEEVERDKTAKELLSVVESLRDPLVDFFNLAALVGETERRDDTVARLGAYADKIGVDTLLIESKLTEALEELQSAYAVLKSRAGRTARAEPASSGFAGFAWPSTPTSTGSRWPLLRMLRKEGLIKARLAVVAKKRELQTHARRRAQMAILSVMRDAGDNEAFKEKASSGVMDVLTQVVKINADVGDFEIVKEALKLGRSVDPQKAKPLLAIARQMADRMVAGSLASKQPLARTLEVVDLCEDLAKASSRRDMDNTATENPPEVQDELEVVHRCPYNNHTPDLQKKVYRLLKGSPQYDTFYMAVGMRL